MTTETASAPTAAALGITGAARTILYVTDFQRALDFYQGTLGLALAYPAEHGWAELSVGGFALCLHGGRAHADKSDGVASFSFSVSDFDAALAGLKERGVAMGEPFTPCGGIRVSHFHDPEGNVLSIEGR